MTHLSSASFSSAQLASRSLILILQILPRPRLDGATKIPASNAAYHKGVAIAVHVPVYSEKSSGSVVTNSPERRFDICKCDVYYRSATRVSSNNCRNRIPSRSVSLRTPGEAPNHQRQSDISTSELQSKTPPARPRSSDNNIKVTMTFNC